MSTPRALLFDLDGTLVDRAAALEAALRALIARHPQAFPDPQSDLAALVAADARGERDRRELCALVARRHPGLGLTADALWREHLGRLADHVRPRPRVIALLRELAQRYRLGLVSDGGGARQRAKLLRAGLADLFQVVVVSGELGHAKPDPRPFQYALERLGCAPAEALHVGDDPRRDVTGARGAGLGACWVADGRTWPPALPAPDLTVERVDDLPRALAQAERGPGGAYSAMLT